MNNNSIDCVRQLVCRAFRQLFLNGLPFATMELKNPLTGQTYRDAIEQYKACRSSRELLLSGKKRAIVHFAVDTEEVWMAAQLSGADTVFIPFNKGCNGGAGNPAVEGDYRTSYLWKEVLRRDSILDILRLFVQNMKVKNGKKGETRLVFPRYHQLDAVRRIVEDVRKNGAGHNYLVQHSAGSGKSNTIAWLAYHLANLYGADNKIMFSSVIVITDRRILDKQLQDNIDDMEHKEGVIVPVDRSAKQLTEALEKGERIIICTLQKFPFVDVQRVSAKGKRFAIIVDEAHSSQTGEASKALKDALADTFNKGEAAIEERLAQCAKEEAQAESDREDERDELERLLAAQGRQANLSFFAFTATPKQKTLEIFGTPDKDGIPHPFHLYSMRQAIEEGFIFNVLENYTTYETYYKLGKSIKDDPKYYKTLANKALGKYEALHKYNLTQKAQIITEHFRTHVKDLIGGNARAMLVTSSRLHAIRYYFAFRDYIKQMHYTDLGVLVAFSGTVRDDYEGTFKDYTESTLNGFPETETPKRFADEYQLLLVAEKYQTGFDQPLLQTMYVDKKLAGVKAVQTLSRINRTCKGKTSTFVLDFANSADEIRAAFQDYYQETSVSNVTDPNAVYDIKHTLDGYKIYLDSEIEAFAKVFFKVGKRQKSIALSSLNAYIDPAIDRYNAKEEQEKEDFKSTLAKFTRLYSFLTHIVRFDDEMLQKFYVYALLLLRKLPRGLERIPDLDNEVRLQYYRTQKTYEDAIALENKDGVLDNTTSGAGKGKDDSKESLSSIIHDLNEKYGTNFTEMDKVMEQLIADMAKDKDLVLRAKNNPLDLYKLAYQARIMNIVINRENENNEFCGKYVDDKQYKADVDETLMPLSYERLRQADTQ